MSEQIPSSQRPQLKLVRGERADEELVAAAAAGDRAAFGELMARYQDRIYGFALRFTANPTDAEDVTQETFLKAYRSIRRFRGDAKFSTWLYQIAKNQCINRFHRGRRRFVHRSVSLDEVGLDQGLPLLQLETDAPSPEATSIADETHAQLAAAIASLEPHYRAALILRDVEDLDYGEIAQILAVPVGTVKSRIHRARAELRARLDETFDAGGL